MHEGWGVFSCRLKMGECKKPHEMRICRSFDAGLFLPNWADTRAASDSRALKLARSGCQRPAARHQLKHGSRHLIGPDMPYHAAGVNPKRYLHCMCLPTKWQCSQLWGQQKTQEGVR